MDNMDSDLKGLAILFCAIVIPALVFLAAFTWARVRRSKFHRRGAHSHSHSRH
jgi:hypothetical protein